MDTIGLIGKKVSKETEGKPFLPDEVITNILSRLPPKSVAKCRLVCRGWRDLTLPRDFVDLIFRNSIPTILVTNPRSFSRLDLFALDKWWDSSTTKKMIHRFPFYSGKFPNISRVLFSHAGLIVLQESPYRARKEVHYNIINPVMPIHECVRITLSIQLWRSKIYGLYFHPILKEYCSLWRIDALDIPWYLPRQNPYKILNLGSNPSLRTISSPAYDIDKKGVTSPLFINNCLYWLLDSLPQVWTYNGRNDIMEFNIISEEFTVIPCPVPWNTECKYNQTRLLNIDGILSFLLILPRKINIWRLEDRAEQLWTTVEYTFNIEINSEAHRVVAVVDGKLALVTKGGSLLVFNLMEGTVRNYQNRKYKDDVWLLSHQMSLVSLSNCIPTITIDLDEKVGAACVIQPI